MVAVVSDGAVAALRDRLDVNAAVRAAYIAVAERQVSSAPVLRVTTQHGAGNFKFAAAGALVGCKLGSYWPGNGALGTENHAATTLLLDAQTGYVRAILAARLLNRLRTAAGNAVAVELLARPDAETLAIIGGGGQAPFEALAISAVRPIRTIRVGLRDQAKAGMMLDALGQTGAKLEVGSVEQAVRGADIVVTVTPARSPLFSADLIAPGTHIAAMGADAAGKQELDPALFSRATLFTDSVAQSLTIGEFQHAAQYSQRIAEIGAALQGTVPGRLDPDEITVFDSSGLAIQDLHVAQAALDLAEALGLTQEIEF